MYNPINFAVKQLRGEKTQEFSFLHLVYNGIAWNPDEDDREEMLKHFWDMVILESPDVAAKNVYLDMKNKYPENMFRVWGFFRDCENHPWARKMKGKT